MNRWHPRLSIDLAAEIDRVAHRQHLNRVHQIVQLLRHALRHQPGRVAIESSRRRLVLQHDGHPPDPTERRNLERVLDPAAPTTLRQAALDRLEDQGGLALLSVMAGPHPVCLQAADWELVTGPAGPTIRPLDPPRPAGYRLSIRRRGGRVREERAELAYFAARPATHLTFNGRPLPAVPGTPPALVEYPLTAPDGVGGVGFPATGELGRTEYLRLGVRFGVRLTVPTDGRLLQGWWDDTAEPAAVGFESSLRRAGECLDAAAERPYQALAETFPHLPPDQRARIKGLLFARLDADWVDRWGGLPLFHANSRDWRYSVADMSGFQRRHGGVPYLPWRWRGRNPDLPVLSTREVVFLRRRFGLDLLIAPPG